jgi:hypothetical protein
MTQKLAKIEWFLEVSLTETVTRKEPQNKGTEKRQILSIKTAKV